MYHIFFIPRVNGLLNQIVVRDLWALRLPDYKLKITSANEDEDGDTDPEVFSSQAAQSDDSEMAFKPNSRYLEWPRLLDSVALCYLAALLMRLPVSVNDFYEYVYSFHFTSLSHSQPSVCKYSSFLA